MSATFTADQNTVYGCAVDNGEVTLTFTTVNVKLLTLGMLLLELV